MMKGHIRITLYFPSSSFNSFCLILLQALYQYVNFQMLAASVKEEYIFWVTSVRNQISIIFFTNIELSQMLMMNDDRRCEVAWEF